MKSSTLRNNTAPFGGAIYISNDKSYKSPGQYEIISNDFEANKANQGGAILADNSNIDIMSNSFRNNSAGFVYDIMGGDEHTESGGAMRLTCSKLEYCQYDVEKNTFEGNQGKNSGGAVSWDGTQPNSL